MKNILSIIPTQSLMYCLICGAGIIAFIFLIIIPNRKASVELDREIKKADERIGEQRILRPVFENLLKRAKQTGETDLPVTQEFKTVDGGINAITDLLREIARRHNLEMKDISTDVSELMKNTKKMIMRLNLTGNFLKFREFLLDLSAISQLEQIEEINIRAIEGTREYNLRIQMAQE
jgi:hypothetical protein